SRVRSLCDLLACPTRRSSDLGFHHPLQQGFEGLWALQVAQFFGIGRADIDGGEIDVRSAGAQDFGEILGAVVGGLIGAEVKADRDRKSTRLNSSHVKSSYAVF